MSIWRNRLQTLLAEKDARSEISEISEKAPGANFGDNGDYGTEVFAQTNPSEPEELEERVAIIAEGSGCRTEWAEGLARLDPNRPPGDVPPSFWRDLCDTAGAFIDRWAARADELGWTTQQVFGCDRYAPFARLDRQGLLWSLVGGTLIELSEIEAIIETPSGSRLRIPKRETDREPARSALVWDEQ